MKHVNRASMEGIQNAIPGILVLLVELMDAGRRFADGFTVESLLTEIETIQFEPQIGANVLRPGPDLI
jgi:hypothetical protein